MRRKSFILLPFVAVAVALWTMSSIGGPSRPARRVEADEPSPGVSSRTQAAAQPQRRAAATLGPRAWTLGLQYMHALDFEQTLALQPLDAKRPAEQAALRVALKGELTATVVDAIGRDFYVEYVLAPAELAFDSSDRGTLDRSTRDAMLAALRRPFYAMFDARGKALLVHVDKDTDMSVQAILRTLVASLQVALPGSTDETWTSTEFDPTGSFEAVYRRVAEPHEYEKSRVRYLRYVTPDGLKPVAGGMRIAPSGRTHFTLDERLWIDTLSADERVVVQAPGAPAAVGSLKLEYRLIAQREEPARIGAFQTQRARLAPSALASASIAVESETDRLRRIVDGATLPDLVKRLKSPPDDPRKRGPATARVMEQMIALFQLEPERALAVPELIRGTPQRDVYSPLIGSLSAATTAESVRALAEISADDRLARDMRVDAIAGMGVVKQPDREGLDQLQELAQSSEPAIRSTAALAVGTTARTLRANGDAAGDAALAHVLEQVANAGDPAERALQLKALANTASPDGLRAIEAALASDSVEVRTAAVIALRLIPDARADQLLSAQLLRDASPDVRRRAIFASGFRPLDPLLPALAEAMTKDPSDAVRMDAVRLIGEHRNDLKDALALLTTASQGDPNPDIRNAASAFLDAARR